MGNVLSEMKRGDEWKILGVLRSFAQAGRIRVIGSGFQEFFLKQQEDYTGPWVNFASTLPLTGLSRNELDEFVVMPLTLWADVKQQKELRELIIRLMTLLPVRSTYCS